MFEWDEAKSARNRAVRGFGFDIAIRIFAGPLTEQMDVRKDYNEDRVIATDEFGGLVFVVVYTRRGESRRIISVRRANRRERHAYYQAITKASDEDKA